MSRTVGRVELPKGDEMCISQVQHATDTDYEIQDVEKRAEFEKRKAEQLKEIKENKGE